MAAFAKGLPVFFIPEQALIPTVRYYVIDHRRWGKPVFFHAFHTQRMLTEIPLSGDSPPGIIPAGIGSATKPVTAPRHMIFAEYLTLLAEARTSGIAARPFRFVWHFSS